VEIHLFTTTQPPIQGVPGALSLGVKRPRRETDHSSPPVPRSRMCGGISPLPQHAFQAWCSVKKHWDNFTFTLPYITYLIKNVQK